MDEEVHYHGYNGVDRSNAPSTTQPQKERHCDWYKRAVDSLTHRDNWRETRLKSPDFRGRRLTVSTREGSGRGTAGSGVAVGSGPTEIVSEGVGSAGGGGRRTRTFPARGGRSESWRDLGSL